MKGKRCAEPQVVFALQQAKVGTAVAEICRKMGVAEATFYRWKKRYGGLGVSEVQRLRQLEDDNRRLKQLVAELTPRQGDAAGGVAKKRMKPTRRRVVVAYLQAEYMTYATLRDKVSSYEKAGNQRNEQRWSAQEGGRRG